MAEEKRIDLSEDSKRKVITFDRGSLKRLIGTAALFSIGYGDVGSSIYYALGVTAFWALGAAPIAIAIAGVFFAFTVFTYAELSSAIPEAGGSQLFAKRAFGDVASFIAGWALLLDYVLTMAISAFTVAPYLGYFFPILKTPQGHLIFTAALIGALTLINIIGIKESTNLTLTLAVFDIITQLSIIVIGVVAVLNLPYILSNIHIGTSPTWQQFIYGITIAMVAYTGIEAVSQLSGETRDPGKKVPRAMLMTLATVIFMYMGISLIALSTMSAYDLGHTWINDPIAGIAANMPVFGKYLAPWIAILGAMILTIAANAGIIGASRLSFSMANNYQIPGIFNKLHHKLKTPVISLLVFSTVGAVVILASRRLEILADLYNFGAMLAFSMAHLSLIGLRIKEPALERPFELKGCLNIKGYKIPITAILGFMATFGVWLVVVFTHQHGRNLGFMWMGLGAILYFAYRYKMKMPIMDTVEIEKVEVAEYKKIEIKKILVPTLGGPQTENIQIACQIAKQNNADLSALYVLEIPAALPIDTFLPEKLGDADAALHRAQAIGREFGIGVETHLLQSRSAGTTIIELARDGKYDLIVMGASAKKPYGGVFVSSTIDHVLKNAPCRVWVCKS